MEGGNEPIVATKIKTLAWSLTKYIIWVICSKDKWLKRDPLMIVNDNMMVKN